MALISDDYSTKSPSNRILNVRLLAALVACTNKRWQKIIAKDGDVLGHVYMLIKKLWIPLIRLRVQNWKP